MEPDLLGIDRLVEDVGDQLIGAAPIVDIMVVAQCEIPELHHLSPLPDRYAASLIGRSALPSPWPSVQSPPLCRHLISPGSHPGVRHNVHFFGCAAQAYATPSAL